MSRSRRLIWLLSALLTLGSLQAAPVSGRAPFAQVRGAVSLVLSDLFGEESQDPEFRYPPARTCQTDLFNPAEPPRAMEWLASLIRFQLPPPAIFIRYSNPGA